MNRDILELRRRVAALEAELAQARLSHPDIAALRQSERRYRALVQASTSTVWSADATGNGREGTEWWERVTGQTRGEAAGWGWLDAVPPEDREAIRQAWDAAFSQRRKYEAQFRVRDVNGRWRHLRAQGIPLFDDAGNLIEWVGTLTDETDYREALAALRASEQRYRTIFDLAAVGIVEARIPDGVITLANERFAGMLGQNPAGHSLFDLTHPEDAGQFRSLFDALAAGQASSLTLEQRFVRPGGGAFWAEVYASLLRDDSGKPLYTVAIVKDRTARRAAEEALRQGSARLQLVADSVPALISYIDSNFVYRFANRTYEEWFGLPQAEISGKTVSEVLGQEAFEKLRPSMERAIAGEMVRFEGWAPYASGNRYIRASYIPERGADGGVAGFAVLVEDLTREHETADRIARLNRELQDRVRDFEVLFHTMPVAVAVARDAEARDIRVNRYLAGLLGTSTEENVSASAPHADQMPYRFLRNGEPLEASELPQQRAHRERRAIENAEIELRTADGSIHHLYGSAVPLFDPAGNVRGSIAAYVDVTDRKRAEEALRQSERRLRRLIDTSPFGIEIGSFDGSVHYANESFLRMLGYTAEDVTGGRLNWRGISPAEWLPLDERMAAQLVETGVAHPVEKEYLHKNGSRVPVLVGACLLEQPFSERQQVVTFVLDLRARRRAEAELRAANEELRRANTDLQEFAYAAAHDLQEPLRMVSLYTQLFARRYAHIDEPAQLLIRQIVDSATRAQTLVADLLAYTRVIHGQAEDPDWVDANAVAAEVLGNLNASLQETGGVVRVSPLPSVRVSRSHLVQLMQNLIGNALKYTRAGVRPEIEVSAEQHLGHWVFRVADNGPGIKPEYRERVFGVFKRLHGKEVPGTGIGLAICRRIVERYGGQIWVEGGSKGEGAAFLFTLPVEYG